MTSRQRRWFKGAGSVCGRLVVAASVVGVAVLAACTAENSPPAASDAPASNSAELAKIARIAARVERRYVEPVSRRKLYDNALKGMLSGLDPHSSYMTPVEYAELRSDMEGEFGGIGLKIEEQDGWPKVLAPIDGTPAARAGIEPGDRIVAIAGQPTNGMQLTDVVTRLRGPIGTRVTFTIERDDKPPFPVTLTRATINVPTVKSRLEPGRIGYVRLSTFGDNTQPELLHALATLKRRAGGHLKGFILDLRDNPGGELASAVEVAGDFVEGGTVVSTRGREPSDDRAYQPDDPGDRIAGTPMVALIDAASASASEIVAAALQDDRRATLMGTRSFGKGSVQSIIPLESGGALRLTTALYFTPDGRSIQGIGIEPNIVVPLPAKEEVANQMALHESDLAGALRNPTQAAQRTVARLETSSSARPIKPTLIATAQDAELKAALAYLKSGAPLKAAGPVPAKVAAR